MFFHWHAPQPDDGPAMSTLTVLAPLQESLDAANSRLAGFDARPSPFAASGRTHFARLLVLDADLRLQARPQGMRLQARLIDLLTHQGRPQVRDPLSRSYLLFAAAYDPVPGDDGTGYVEHLREQLRAGADELWRGCDGYPGAGWTDAAGFGRFFAENRIRAGYVFTPPERASVSRIRAALDLRRKAIVAAGRTQQLAPAQLRAEVKAAFGGPAPAPDLRLLAGDSDETAAWNDRVRRDAEEFTSRARPPARARLEPGDLDDVQGLAVGYRQHLVAAHLLLRIVDAGRAREWLASTEVTSVAQARASGQVSGPATNIAVTHAGLQALGVAAQDLRRLDVSYQAGMAQREDALVPGVGTRPWEQHFQDGQTHLLVQVSAADGDALEPALDDLLASLAASGGFAPPYVQRGQRIPSPHPGYDGFVEHFGFADGLSQPRFAGLTRSSDPDGPQLGGQLLPPGELLLGYQDVDGDVAGDCAPEWLCRNGSYLVWRKLEQDVPRFRALAAEVPGAASSQGSACPADVATRLVGRGRDGAPLLAVVPAPAPGQSPGPAQQPGAAAGLSFAADPEGFGCPVGSHVRRVNPRDSAPLLAHPAIPSADGIEQRLVRRHRMLRRGIPYGPFLPAGAQDDEAPNGGRGLLFVALVADIGRQFEFVQTQWMSDGNALRLGSDPDVFSGVAGPGRKVTLQGDPPVFVPLPEPVVTCRGGEYFLLPGLDALRRLAQA